MTGIWLSVKFFSPFTNALRGCILIVNYKLVMFEFMDNNTWNSMTAGVLIGGLIIGFLVGWFWHKSVVTDLGASEGTQFATSTGQFPTTTPDITGGTNNGQNSQQAAVIGSTASGKYYGSPDKTVDGSGSVSVNNQKAGTVVTLESVTLDTDGWVAIRDDQNGLMGNILGAQLLAKGTHNNVKINLLRATTAGKTYHAVVYREDGKKGFAKAGDMVVMSNGTAVSDTFKAE